MGWKRPPGPARVWKKVEITDSNGINREFTIQEIPEERYEEAVDHMCNIFIRDLNIFSCFNLVEDPKAVSVLREIWSTFIREGVSVAAYDTTGNPEKPILAGLNMLIYRDDEFEEKMMHMEFEGILKKLFLFAVGVAAEVDPREAHGVEGYMSAFGLSVDPIYRRLGLGKRLLNARELIGREYNIQYTSTLFTTDISQKAAERCGFVVKMDRPFDSILDDDDQKLFPKLSGTNFKIMEKKLF